MSVCAHVHYYMLGAKSGWYYRYYASNCSLQLCFRGFDPWSTVQPINVPFSLVLDERVQCSLVYFVGTYVLRLQSYRLPRLELGF